MTGEGPGRAGRTPDGHSTSCGWLAGPEAARKRARTQPDTDEVGSFNSARGHYYYRPGPRPGQERRVLATKMDNARYSITEIVAFSFRCEIP